MRTSAGCFYMDQNKFSKRKLGITEQIAFLQQQGLLVNDKKMAQHVLGVVGYYRFSGYLLPFKNAHTKNNHRTFKAGTTFDTVWQLYQFDRELRLLLSDAIEKVEVAFRAALAENTAEALGMFWYIEPEHYRDKRSHRLVERNVEKVLKDKQEVFIQHYVDKYHEPGYPPIWMIIETLSFGTCTKMFTGIQKVCIRQSICEIFDQHTTIIESWLRTIVWVRNLCAHHSRVWNRWLIYAPIIPKTDQLHDYLQNRNRRIIVCAYLLARLLEKIAPKSPWLKRLYDLFAKYDAYPGPAMGFANSWRDDPIWDL